MFSAPIETANQEVHFSPLKEKNIRLFLKREDQIHPFVSGNKYRKLKYNMKEATNLRKDTLLTFGGAFSNHIVAVAVAGNRAGLKTIGVIRGEELGVDLAKTIATNATLREAHAHGMQFHWISRAAYRTKTTPNFIASLKATFGDFYLIPEGGTNPLAVRGCEEILTSEDARFQYVCAAVGTGGTLAGLINAARSHQKVLGFPALKGDFLTKEITHFIRSSNRWDLIDHYHFGGYARYNESLISFINSFKEETNILLDPIYTGKMLFGIVDLIKKNYFSENTSVLAIHTGGLQGINGFNRMLAKKNQKLINLS